MTFLFEVSRPWLWRPFVHFGPAMFRAGGGLFAIGVIYIPFDKFTTTKWVWSDE